MDRPVDSAYLQRLESRLRLEGAGLVSVLQAGLNDQQLVAATAGLPFSLPPELRTWWQWHNGFDPESPSEFWQIGGLRSLYPLEVALDTYSWSSVHYGPMWLPIFGGLPTMYADCAPNASGRTPIYIVEDTDPTPTEPAFQSLRALLDAFTTLWDVGYWYANADGTLGYNDAKRPDDLWLLGVT